MMTERQKRYKEWHIDMRGRVLKLVGALAIVNDSVKLKDTDWAEPNLDKFQREIFELARSVITIKNKQPAAAFLEILAETNLKILETMQGFNYRWIPYADIGWVAGALEDFRAIDWEVGE